MPSLLRSVSYVPILKWKTGERLALSTLRGPLRGLLTPLFLMPPSGDFDHEKGRCLTPLEHIKLFGSRLYKAWGRVPVFVDAIGIDDETHRQGLTVHPLTELLEQARTARALACPATRINRTPEYQEAVLRFVERHPHLPICVRVNPLDDMESASFAADLLTLLDRLGCGPDRVLLVLDFEEMGAPKAHEVDPLAEVVANRFYQAFELAPWLKVVVAITSFPTAPKMKPGEVKRFPRTDWLTYCRLIEREPDLLQTVAFGDYAIDSAPFGKVKARARPSAHLRYTTPGDYLIVKGQQVKKPVGYEAIYPVADTLAGRDEFMGPAFSDGDAFVSRLAARDADITTGNASTWRWAGTDHHFAQVLGDLRVLAGHEREDEEAASEISVQVALF